MAKKKQSPPLASLNRRLLRLASQVSDAVVDSIRALAERDVDLAGRIVAGDDAIDREEVVIEQEAIALLTDAGPDRLGPADMRCVLCVIKVNNDLERVADCAENIAERLAEFVHRDAPPLPPDLCIMANSAYGMLRDAVNAWAAQSPEQATPVLRADDVVDALYEQLAQDLSARVIHATEPQHSAHYLDYLIAARNYERIADHATNIAECVIQSATGQIVRHAASRTPVDSPGA